MAGYRSLSVDQWRVYGWFRCNPGLVLSSAVLGQPCAGSQALGPSSLRISSGEPLSALDQQRSALHCTKAVTFSTEGRCRHAASLDGVPHHLRGGRLDRQPCLLPGGILHSYKRLVCATIPRDAAEPVPGPVFIGSFLCASVSRGRHPCSTAYYPDRLRR